MNSIEVPHLFECWPEVASRFELNGAIALFLDFDGTLAPLEPRPEDVWLDNRTRRILSRLVRSARFRVWVVTGRRLADVRERMGVPGIHYLGLHGWEGRSPHQLSDESSEALNCARSWLSCLMLKVPGVWLEDKGLTFAIHYRSAADEGARSLRKVVHGVLAPFSDSLQLIRGKKVWEIAPREMGDKGIAVKAELSERAENATPVYVGDDLMDEPAFTALCGGVTVHVGATLRTGARYRLNSVGQVRQFLNRLAIEFASAPAQNAP